MDADTPNDAGCTGVDRARARAAKEVLAAQLAGREGIVGIGLAGRAQDHRIKVNVREASVAEQVPGSVEGVPVLVAVVGRIRAQD